MASIPPETAAEIQKLEQLHNQHPEGRYFVPLADRYRKLGMTEQAETLLRDGLRLHPDYLSAHIVLGGCLADRGATDDAADEFRYVLSSTFSPARNVFSITAPVRTFLSFVRTNAPPFPGFTCWK